MRTTRISLIPSPLLLLLPSVEDVLAGSSVSGMMTVFFYEELFTFFPWNLVLAGLAYLYANHRGRSAPFWAFLVLLFPFVVPLILACMPAKAGSASAMLRRKEPAPAAVSLSTAVPIEERLPLLDGCLSEGPEETRVEQKNRFARVAANPEFSLWADRSAADRIAGEATTRDFTVWMKAGESAVHLYGASKIRPDRIEAILGWLRGASAPGRVLTVALREPDGGLKMTEYHTAEASGAGA